VIARIWRGWTRREDTDEYAAYVRATGIDAYTSTPGNHGAWILRRDEGERTEFVTLSFWESRDAIRAFAGDDIEKAVFYPDDDRFLVDRDWRVAHYEINQ
jgi:heme-degrading monooxygenase HmoA